MAAHVLVVDGDALVRRGLVALVRTLGYEVTAAACGEEAIAATSRERFDVVLLNQRMPSLTGVETWARLGALEPAPAPVLVTAAIDGPALADRNGMLFLGKPFGAAELRQTIEAALTRREQ